MPHRFSAGVALLLVLTLTACAGPTRPVGAEPSPITSTAPPAPAPTPTIQVPVASAALTEPVAVVPPISVRIEALGIEVPVIPVGVESDSFMELPEDPAIAGWYRFGPAPGTGSGNTVISAHIDSPRYPIGPFAALRDVPVGAEVSVASADGSSVRYAVESVTYYAKTELPVDELFARGGPPALVLITCGGEFDSATGRYRDNVVLIARSM
ncbi:hypothetical protein ASD56_06135 [Microbacterium sp. Root166]|uniref:class F sortase n=1 Tax=Microbacterium sp. Root166 TaxID=1736478 RepID=UPI0006FB6F56|nr:class F sortase [Microbacterium sp. Root166]KQZ85857.1 hypothetical protein ASD56_06135 [Microbacterium sp. Root166]